MFSATICNYTEIDTDDILMGCKGQEEMLCMKEEFCLAANEEMFPIGMVKEDKTICKLGLGICTYALKMPEVCVLGEGKCLCCRGAAACPFKDPVPKPVRLY